MFETAQGVTKIFTVDVYQQQIS